MIKVPPLWRRPLRQEWPNRSSARQALQERKSLRPKDLASIVERILAGSRASHLEIHPELQLVFSARQPIRLALPFCVPARAQARGRLWLRFLAEGCSAHSTG